MDELVKKLKSDAMAIAAPAFLATIDGLIEMGVFQAKKGQTDDERREINVRRKEIDRMRGKAYDTIIKLALDEAKKLGKKKA